MNKILDVHFFLFLTSIQFAATFYKKLACFSISILIISNIKSLKLTSKIEFDFLIRNILF